MCSVQERAEKLNNTAVNNTALSLSVSNNSLVEQLFNLLESTNTSATNRNSNNNTNTVLLSITVPSQVRKLPYIKIKTHKIYNKIFLVN